MIKLSGLASRKLLQYIGEKWGYLECTCFGSTYTKIGTIQRRLAWPLRKDDTQIREAFHIFLTWVEAPGRQGSRGLNPCLELGLGGGQSSPTFTTTRDSDEWHILNGHCGSLPGCPTLVLGRRLAGRPGYPAQSPRWVHAARVSHSGRSTLPHPERLSSRFSPMFVPYGSNPHQQRLQPGMPGGSIHLGFERDPFEPNPPRGLGTRGDRR